MYIYIYMICGILFRGPVRRSLDPLAEHSDKVTYMYIDI